jgi:hypothetical protein
MSLKKGDKLKVIFKDHSEDAILKYGDIITVEAYDGSILTVEEDEEEWSYPDVHFFEAL